jgi:23S rRNA (guanosine2251-2'-O)-methyltransferase
MAIKKIIDKKPQELIFGIHPIIELLKAKRRSIIHLYTTKPVPKGWHLIEEVLPSTVPVSYATREILNKMAGTSDHQGFVAKVTPFTWRKQFFDPTRQPSLLLLDRIQDPRNLGAILRSAYCTNIDGVIVCKKGGAPLSATALKSSAGLAEHLELYEAPTAGIAVAALKKAGYTIYLAMLDGADATKTTFTRPSCLVIGNEGEGISSDIISSGIKITLPQKNRDISYNASVAAGILLFLIATQTRSIAPRPQVK